MLKLFGWLIMGINYTKNNNKNNYYYKSKDVPGIPIKLNMICNECGKTFKMYFNMESEYFIIDKPCKFCCSIDTEEKLL